MNHRERGRKTNGKVDKIPMGQGDEKWDSQIRYRDKEIRYRDREIREGPMRLGT